MTRALERCGAKRTRARRGSSRDDDYRDRVKQHHLARIENADTPFDHAREAGDYLVDILRFVRDSDQAWDVAHQISKVIVHVADGLSEHVSRGGRQ